KKDQPLNRYGSLLASGIISDARNQILSNPTGNTGTEYAQSKRTAAAKRAPSLKYFKIHAKLFLSDCSDWFSTYKE
ncbi:MAG: hypothetical protein PVI38_20315, partial [Desulfobacterales bacterium]